MHPFPTTESNYESHFGHHLTKNNAYILYKKNVVGGRCLNGLPITEAEHLGPFINMD